VNFEPFFRDMQIMQKLSPLTIRAYRNDLELFETFAGAHSITDVSQITRETVQDYIGWLRQRKNRRTGHTGCADSSITRRLAALSTYIDFMQVTSGSTLNNPVKMRTLNKWRRNDEPKPVEEWTLDLLLASIPSERDRMLFTFGVATGLRVSEIQQLNRDSVTIKAETLPSGEELIIGCGEVVGKGNKRRRFYVDSMTLGLLFTYLASRTDSNPALFISQRRQRMSIRAMEERLAHWCKAIGFSHINVHRLRHTYATRLANAHISSTVLRELMGHRSFTTTQKYFKLTDNTLAQGYHAAMEYYRS
jgi:site-specific recombinase XerD